MGVRSNICAPSTVVSAYLYHHPEQKSVHVPSKISQTLRHLLLPGTAPMQYNLDCSENDYQIQNQRHIFDIKKVIF